LGVSHFWGVWDLGFLVWGVGSRWTGEESVLSWFVCCVDKLCGMEMASCSLYYQVVGDS